MLGWGLTEQCLGVPQVAAMSSHVWGCYKKTINLVLGFKVEKKKSYLNEVIMEGLMEEVGLKV